jgi:hypothetical protein
MNFSGGMAVFIFDGIFFIFMFILFFSMYRKSKRRAPIEEGKQALYSENFTGYIDGEKELFMRLRIYDGFLVISCTHLLVLRADDIDTVQVGWNFLNKSVKINYHASQMAQSVSFLSMNCENLKKMIDTHLHLVDRFGYR